MIDSPDFFETLIGYTGQAFFAYERSTNKLLYQSPAFRAIFRFTSEYLHPNEFLEKVFPEDRAYIKECLRELLEWGTSKPLEFRVLQQNGHEKWVCLTPSIPREKEWTQIILGHVEDITVQRNYNDYLKRFSNKKDSILTILSHDLSGPLAMIRLLSEQLKEELQTGTGNNVLEAVQLIERSSEHGINLVQDLLKQEFLESVQTALVTRRVNLVEKIGDMLEEYQGKRGHLLSKKLMFLPSSKEIYAYVDDIKFLQVITNLVSNAIKFTPDGGRIIIGLADQNESIVLKVSDTGIGIPKQYHSNLFEKFTAARRPGLNGEPTIGLGLYVCKTLVEWHKGEIWFESEESKGTTFFVRIPKE